MPSPTPRCSPRADGERSFPGTLWSRKQCRETGARYTPVTRKLLETISDRNGAGAAVIAFLRASKIGRVGPRGMQWGWPSGIRASAGLEAAKGFLHRFFRVFPWGAMMQRSRTVSHCFHRLTHPNAAVLTGAQFVDALLMVAAVEFRAQEHFDAFFRHRFADHPSAQR